MTRSKSWSWCLALGLLASLGGPARSSRAQPSDGEGTSGTRAEPLPDTLATSEPTDPPGYLDAIEVGLAEYELGHYEEARGQFERAHAIAPNARTLRALGNVDFELRNYGDCVTHLRAALESDVKPLTGTLRRRTEELLARARVYVGEVHVHVDPESATVSVDGVVVARGPQAQLALLVGRHILEFKAQGRVPERRAVSVQGGGETRLEVTLPEVEQPLVKLEVPGDIEPGRTPVRTDHGSSLRKRRWVWVVAGILAAAGVGTAIGLSQRRGDYRERAPVRTTVTLPDSVIQALGSTP